MKRLWRFLTRGIGLLLVFILFALEPVLEWLDRIIRGK